MVRKLSCLVVAMLMLAGVAAPVFAQSGTVRIACVVTSLTGALAKNGEYITHGIKMAVDEVNASGGINGKKLEVVFLDDQVKSSEAINAVKKAIEDLKSPVILGSDSSGLVLASMPIAAEAKIPQIVSGTNVRITGQGVPSIFRMRANDSVAAKIIAEYVVSKGFKKPGIIYTNEDYGKGFMAEVQKNFERLGMPSKNVEVCNIGDTDFTAQILKLKAGGVDTILALGKEIETAKFIRQTRELGFKVPIFGGSPLGLDYVVELAGKENMEGVRIVTHFLPNDSDPRIKKWVADYMKLYPNEIPQTHAAAYYDATKIVAAVMSKYGTSSDAIIKGLKELDYTGIQSRFKGSATGDLVTKQVVGEFKKGEWVVVDKIE